VVLIVWVVVAIVILLALVVLWYIIQKRRNPKPINVLNAVGVHHTIASESSTAEKPTELENVVISEAATVATPTAKATGTETANQEQIDETAPPQQQIQREWLARNALTPGEPMPTTPGI